MNADPELPPSSAFLAEGWALLDSATLKRTPAPSLLSFFFCPLDRCFQVPGSLCSKSLWGRTFWSPQCADSELLTLAVQPWGSWGLDFLSVLLLGGVGCLSVLAPGPLGRMDRANQACPSQPFSGNQTPQTGVSALLP